MRVHYYIDTKKPAVRCAVCFFALSFVLRLCWCIIWPKNVEGMRLYTYALLPLLACLLAVLFLLLFGRGRLYLTFIPVALGVLFFIIKSTTFLWWHQVLCTLLYLLVAGLYGVVVFGIFPVRKLLIPLFGIPLAFHVLVEDPFFHLGEYGAPQWVQEGSVLCIMAGLLLISLSMRELEER